MPALQGRLRPAWRFALCSWIAIGCLTLVAVGCRPASRARTPDPTRTASEAAAGTSARALLAPATRIAHERIDECSGIVWHGGAFYVHNDSGDDPLLYRSPELDFASAEVLAVPGAQAIDWEDITVWRGDLLVGDIGDNGRRREQIDLYRARYHAGAGGKPGRLELIAHYPCRYPDGAHDAEALLAIDGQVHIVIKNRGEASTFVYALPTLTPRDELAPGTVNEAVRVGQLDIGAGAQVTAGTYDAQTETLVLLTYTHILQYRHGRLAGQPEKRTLVAARQCEALCLQETRLVFTNEQRDVFVIDDFLASDWRSLLPPRGEAYLPVRGPSVRAADLNACRRHPCTSCWEAVALQDAVVGEAVRWEVADGCLHLAGRLRYDEALTPTAIAPPAAGGEAPRPQLGSALLLAFGSEPRWRLSAQEVILAAGIDAAGRARLWQLDFVSGPFRIEPCSYGQIELERRGGPERELAFELALPVARIWGTPWPERLLFDLHGYRLREEDPVRLSGIDTGTLMRPYLWADVRRGAP